MKGNSHDLRRVSRTLDQFRCTDRKSSRCTSRYPHGSTRSRAIGSVWNVARAELRRGLRSRESGRFRSQVKYLFERTARISLLDSFDYQDSDVERTQSL